MLESRECQKATTSFYLGPSWQPVMEEELSKPYIRGLADFLCGEIAAGELIYPPPPLIFNAFHQTPYEETRVVIIGQDPYHGPGQAEGMSFSVADGVALPPSLRNIFKELKEDLGILPPASGSLLKWAQQGVLLLNATLTVRARQPKSHYGRGWERFTDAVVLKLLDRVDPPVFLLWGKSAQEKVQHIEGAAHSRASLLCAPHPSPYSADSGFFGCRHFSKANRLLEEMGKQPIDWIL
jgi:uracil-DNA glycosylase